MKFSAQLQPGKNNLFDESLFKRGAAAKFKKALASSIKGRMDSLKMDVKQAAHQTGCSQADIKRLRKGEVAGYSLEELVGLARKFNLRVNVAINPPQAQKSVLH